MTRPEVEEMLKNVTPEQALAALPDRIRRRLRLVDEPLPTINAPLRAPLLPQNAFPSINGPTLAQLQQAFPSLNEEPLGVPTLNFDPAGQDAVYAAPQQLPQCPVPSYSPPPYFLGGQAVHNAGEPLDLPVMDFNEDRSDKAMAQNAHQEQSVGGDQYGEFLSVPTW